MRKEKFIKYTIYTLVLLAVLSACIMLVMQSHQRQVEVALLVLIPLMAGLWGYAIGQGRTRAAIAARPASRPAEAETVHLPREGIPSFMLEMFRQSSQMHECEDLFERYHYFTVLAELLLNRAVARCSISLWCQDKSQEHLVECLIQTTSPAAGQTAADHRPVTMPIRSESIVNALRNRKPWCGDLRALLQPPDAAGMRCDACIPLYRKYGQPLLIVIRWLDEEKGYLAGSAKKVRERFNQAAELTGLVWQQMQTANQREWQIMHDGGSRALRADIFVDRAQRMAAQCARSGEPFTVAVLTVRGFRRMFAGHSRTWNQLSGMLGGTLGKALENSGKDIVLGKMADDVFALLLPRTDEFLAGQLMRRMLEMAGEEIRRESELEQHDVLSIEMDWAALGHRRYRGQIAAMLDEIYQGMFSGQNQLKRNHWLIELQPAMSEGDGGHAGA